MSSVTLDAKARAAAVGEILASGPWEFFVANTFAHDISDRRAFERFRDYCRTLAKITQGHFLRASSWGHQPENGRPHFHWLCRTGGDARRPLALDDFREVPWPGTVFVERPRDQQNCASYLLKERHQLVGMDTICPRFPPCKRSGRGCRIADRPLPRFDEIR